MEVLNQELIESFSWADISFSWNGTFDEYTKIEAVIKENWKGIRYE
jgi:hypothetical protein